MNKASRVSGVFLLGRSKGPKTILLLSVFLTSILGISFRADAAESYIPSIDPYLIAHKPMGCGPTSDPVTDEEGRTFAFCMKWNPEFVATGNVCCHNPFVRPRRGRRMKLRACSRERMKTSFCDDRTPDQKQYEELAAQGKLGDLLEYLRGQTARSGKQDQCGPNNGFLAYGRGVVPTETNHLRLRNPKRCANYGTDAMVAMLEWLGRKVGEQYRAPTYTGVRLTIGDISAPRGGCLAGWFGRRGHSSHTNGQDVDLGFLVAVRNQPSPLQMSYRFDVAENWWLLSNVLQNPFACVKRVFLDRRLIRALARYAKDDPVWKSSHSILQHARGHRNHFHIRLGDRVGLPGCLGQRQEGVELDEEEDLVSDPSAAAPLSESASDSAADSPLSSPADAASGAEADSPAKPTN